MQLRNGGPHENLLKTSSLIGASRMPVRSLERQHQFSQSLDKQKYQTSRNSGQGMANSPSLTEESVGPGNIVSVYEMWRENPNLRCSTQGISHSLGKKSFNKQYQAGQQQIHDKIIQMNINMPKLYCKSL